MDYKALMADNKIKQKQTLGKLREKELEIIELQNILRKHRLLLDKLKQFQNEDDKCK